MNTRNAELTHIAGTFLIQADGAFLNGAGLGEGEDRNVTIPKTFRDGRNEVPYVSAQAWKRWLRTTTAQEAGWPLSEPQAVGWNPKGNVNKIAGQLNPVDFPEDDIFGYMRAQEGQGRRKAAGEEEDEDAEGSEEQDTKIRAVMRASPFAASLLVSLRSTGWRGEDEGFVHLTKYDPRALGVAEVERFLDTVSTKQQDKKKDVWRRLADFDKTLAVQVKPVWEGSDLVKLRELLQAKAGEQDKQVSFIEGATSPLPYTTRFYNTHLQGIFCLNYSRLGVFWNVGDRFELEEATAREFVRTGKIEDVTTQAPYNAVTQNGRAGRIFRLANADEARKGRATALLTGLALLRGGAKQAQFGTDVSPKAVVLAGLTCGNPIFNHLFKDDTDGPLLKIDTLKDVIADYADRIVNPVVVGIRAGYLRNEAEVRSLAGWYKVEKRDGAPTAMTLTETDHSGDEKREDEFWVQVRVASPLDATRCIGEILP